MECPKCGGTTGFEVILTVLYNQRYNWEGKEVDAESFDGHSQKTCECSDCGTKLRRSTIEKLRAKEQL